MTENERLARIIIIEDGIRNINMALADLVDVWKFSAISPVKILEDERFRLAQERLALKAKGEVVTV